MAYVYIKRSNTGNIDSANTNNTSTSDITENENTVNTLFKVPRDGGGKRVISLTPEQRAAIVAKKEKSRNRKGSVAIVKSKIDSKNILNDLQIDENVIDQQLRNYSCDDIFINEAITSSPGGDVKSSNDITRSDDKIQSIRVKSTLEVNNVELKKADYITKSAGNVEINKKEVVEEPVKSVVPNAKEIDQTKIIPQRQLSLQAPVKDASGVVAQEKGTEEEEEEETAEEKAARVESLRYYPIEFNIEM